MTLADLRAGRCAGATRLTISEGLTEFPREIFDLADSLEILDLSGNHLTALPDDLGRLQRLRVMFASDNAFSLLPEVLGSCPRLTQIGFRNNRLHTIPTAALPPALRWLILTGNHIAALPEALGQRPLEKVALAGNRLTGLPDSFASCDRLALLRISANPLGRFPEVLRHLPRLAWLAYGGSPLTEATETRHLAEDMGPLLAWPDLCLGTILGSGASGVIHAATGPQGDDLAIKVFKGALTSDGLPSSEQAAWIAAGQHPHLIGLQARLRDHPNGSTGLVMPRIPGHYQRLADPPSLESCSRDVYANGQHFSNDQVARLVRGIASAAAHLHGRGLLHGDLYGHNILWDGQGHAMLGDFGAATFLTEDLAPLEILALGHLLEELLARVSNPAPGLITLRNHCQAPVPAHRPTAEDVSDALSGW